MERIRGHYEWDDDELIPGRKREGGLHQNLYDGDGNLKGSARFVPDDGVDDAPLMVTNTVYLTADDRYQGSEEQRRHELKLAILDAVVSWGFERGLPLANQWWRERARPTLDARRARRHERKARSSRRRSVVEDAVPEEATEIAARVEDLAPEMSRAEAQARYLAAAAARAYGDEQLRLVASARIVDGEDAESVRRSISERPAGQLRSVIESMVLNPALLQESNLAQLASLLDREREPEH